jgi:hypothetical protein
VCLYRGLADVELATDLFIQQAGDYQRHDLPFARGKRRVTVPERPYLRVPSKFSEAVAEMQVASHLLGEAPAEYARLGYAYAMAGDRPQAETILRNLMAESSAGHPRAS